MGAIIFFAASLVIVGWSLYKAPVPAPECKTLKSLSVPTGKPDPTHGNKTIAQRAYEVLNAYPLGLKVDQYPREKWLGVWVRFVVEIHPPDSGIAVDHKGVTVKECVQ